MDRSKKLKHKKRTFIEKTARNGCKKKKNLKDPKHLADKKINPPPDKILIRKNIKMMTFILKGNPMNAVMTDNFEKAKIEILNM